MHMKKSSDIDIKGLSSNQLEALARRAILLANVIKPQEPSLDDALKAGIESYTIKCNSCSHRQAIGYRGQVTFVYKGEQWLAKGHSGQFDDGSFWGKSFVEFLQLTGTKRPSRK